jgi:hypothetical protein
LFFFLFGRKHQRGKPKKAAYRARTPIQKAPAEEPPTPHASPGWLDEAKRCIEVGESPHSITKKLLNVPEFLEGGKAAVTERSNLREYTYARNNTSLFIFLFNIICLNPFKVV